MNLGKQRKQIRLPFTSLMLSDRPAIKLKMLSLYKRIMRSVSLNHYFTDKLKTNDGILLGLSQFEFKLIGTIMSHKEVWGSITVKKL